MEVSADPMAAELIKPFVAVRPSPDPHAAKMIDNEIANIPLNSYCRALLMTISSLIGSLGSLADQA